jgi:hypothetical protein
MLKTTYILSQHGKPDPYRVLLAAGPPRWHDLRCQGRGETENLCEKQTRLSEQTFYTICGTAMGVGMFQEELIVF